MRPSPIWSGGRWADPSGTVTVNVVPSPDDALGGDGAAVQLDQLLHQRQPDAAALVGAAPCVLDPVEPLEQPGHLLGGDARAGVPHPQLGGRPGLPQRDGDLALEGELEGVGQEVEDDLLPHLPVHEDRLGQRRTVHHEPQPGPLARPTRKTLARSAVKAARSVGW